MFSFLTPSVDGSQQSQTPYRLHFKHFDKLRALPALATMQESPLKTGSNNHLVAQWTGRYVSPCQIYHLIINVNLNRQQRQRLIEAAMWIAQGLIARLKMSKRSLEMIDPNINEIIEFGSSFQNHNTLDSGIGEN